MSIQRYNCTNGGAQYCQGCYQMTPDPMGDYVRHEDHEKEMHGEACLERRHLDDFAEELERLRGCVAELEDLWADAERYRWLKSEVRDQPLPLAGVVWKRDSIRNSWEWANIATAESMDRLIDAARGRG